MMRRTVLLVVTTALALIAAGGIALAATFTCTTNPCDGTTEDDMITGTVNAETINGNAGNDEISALDANDTLNGEDGIDTMHGELGDDWLNGGDGPDQLFGEYGYDRLNGGAGNDTLDGGADDPSKPSYTDFYLLTTNWGQDTITDAEGEDIIQPVPDGVTAAAMPNLTVDLVSSSGPEYTDGNGNTVNWEGNIVESATTGSGDDVFSQSPKVSNRMSGGAGSDTYKGFTAVDPIGADTVTDVAADGTAGGTADVLDLSSRNLADAELRTPRGSSTSNVRGLQIDFIKGNYLGCVEEWCDYVIISQYFDNTSPDGCLSGPGPGVIETIEFADDPSLEFAQVRRLLGCPTVTNVVPTDGEQNVAPSTNVEATFSEPMNSSTLTTDTFTLTKQNSSTPVTATVSPSSWPTANKATLDPSSDLASNTTYTATIKGGSTGAKDPADQALQEDYSWSFTTAADTTAPRVSTATPTGTGVARGTNATATFSERMDPTSIDTSTFKLFKCSSTTSTNCATQIIDVAVTRSADRLSATLNPFPTSPTTLLAKGTKYKVVVTTGAKDEAGNQLDQDRSVVGNQEKVWYFTTGSR
jgi:hypothetical protein